MLFKTIIGATLLVSAFAAPTVHSRDEPVCKYPVSHATYTSDGTAYGYEDGHWCKVAAPAHDNSNSGRKSYFTGTARPYAGSTRYSWSEQPKNDHWEEAKFDVYKATLCGEKEVPDVVKDEPAFGYAALLFNRNDKTAKVVASHFFAGAITKAHIHGPADTKANASVVFDLLPSTDPNFSTHMNPIRTTAPIQFNDEQQKWLAEGLMYVNIHTNRFPQGAIRGNLGCASEACLAPEGVHIVKFVEDGVCNKAIFEHKDASYEYY
ncbi:CHRD domain-containing protein [Gaertneriomyces semiglobifer]|nr:CHRD domain-containing protein [Gaertneriomyces semiglobifer]